LPSSYEVTSVPTVFLINEEGFVVWIGESYLEGLSVAVDAMWESIRREE